MESHYVPVNLQLEFQAIQICGYQDNKLRNTVILVRIRLAAVTFDA
jgi:hypothetical protein